MIRASVDKLNLNWRLLTGHSHVVSPNLIFKYPSLLNCSWSVSVRRSAEPLAREALSRRFVRLMPSFHPSTPSKLPLSGMWPPRPQALGICLRSQLTSCMAFVLFVIHVVHMCGVLHDLRFIDTAGYFMGQVTIITSSRTDTVMETFYWNSYQMSVVDRRIGARK